ncbi:hypothetical protein [Bacillus luti]|uniref:hypothetical protein n=1 Tax=Bacillus luti TaxID=2026191 RepID=UPI003D062559
MEQGSESFFFIDVQARGACPGYAKRFFKDNNLTNEGKGSLKRSKKKSFDWYIEVIETNGESLES